jgi:hypothetical protein
MIKCGRLKGKDDEVADQCILFTKDGSRALGYFLYSKYGGQKGAKAAAHKREGQVQAFKKKHQGLLDAVEAFGAPVVLKYLLDADCPDCEKVVKAHVAGWLEKARGEGQGVGGERQGDGGADQCVCPKCGATVKHEKGVPCNEQKCPKCGAAMTGQDAEKSEVEKAYKPPPGWNDPRSWLSSKKGAEAIRAAAWKSMGGKQHLCARHMEGKVDDPDAFCAALKDKVEGTTKWRKGRGKKKSFTEETEEALTLLEKHEDEEMELNDIDLSELEAWLAGEEAADVEPEPAKVEPEPESDAEPEPAPEPEPEPEEQELDFRTFLLREHAQRRADILAALGEEVDNE